MFSRDAVLKDVKGPKVEQAAWNDAHKKSE